MSAVTAQPRDVSRKAIAEAVLLDALESSTASTSRAASHSSSRNAEQEQRAQQDLEVLPFGIGVPVGVVGGHQRRAVLGGVDDAERRRRAA